MNTALLARGGAMTLPRLLLVHQQNCDGVSRVNKTSRRLPRDRGRVRRRNSVSISDGRI